ncbi:hypothetical protein Tco_1145094 [Tanacetum coccineum]
MGMSGINHYRYTRQIKYIASPELSRNCAGKIEKSKPTMLMALPEDHLAKFHKMTDAKEMWDAIKSRLGGNGQNQEDASSISEAQF